jgi:hypothetical protein
MQMLRALYPLLPRSAVRPDEVGLREKQTALS